MAQKRNSGFTLIELIVTIAVLAVISIPVGSILINTLNAYNTDKEFQQDQYNVRMALLAMTRDLHSLDEDDVDDTKAVIGSESSKLVFFKSGTDYSYELDNNTLKRIVVDTGLPGDTNVPFIPVPAPGAASQKDASKMTDLHVELEDNRFVTITLSCGPDDDPDRTTVSTTISISRIPPTP